MKKFSIILICFLMFILISTGCFSNEKSSSKSSSKSLSFYSSVESENDDYTDEPDDIDYEILPPDPLLGSESEYYTYVKEHGSSHGLYYLDLYKNEMLYASNQKLLDYNSWLNGKKITQKYLIMRLIEKSEEIEKRYCLLLFDDQTSVMIYQETIYQNTLFSALGRVENEKITYLSVAQTKKLLKDAVISDFNNYYQTYLFGYPAILLGGGSVMVHQPYFLYSENKCGEKNFLLRFEEKWDFDEADYPDEYQQYIYPINIYNVFEQYLNQNGIVWQRYPITYQKIDLSYICSTSAEFYEILECEYMGQIKDNPVGWVQYSPEMLDNAYIDYGVSLNKEELGLKDDECIVISFGRKLKEFTVVGSDSNYYGLQVNAQYDLSEYLKSTAYVYKMENIKLTDFNHDEETIRLNMDDSKVQWDRYKTLNTADDIRNSWENHAKALK